MEHTDSFDFRVLLVAKGEKSANEINHYFVKAGLASMDVETGISNVIPRLNKTNLYDAIILEMGVTADMVMYLGKLRANRVSVSLPIIVLDSVSEKTWIVRPQMYDAGANYVINDPIDEDVANHICWMVQALNTFTEQFKKGSERLYSR
jgi:hypothetical protein